MRGTMIVALIAAGCASIQGASEVFEARFMGGPVNGVIAALGPPELRQTGPGGDTLFWEFAAPREVRTPIYERRAGLLVIAGYRTEAQVARCRYEITTDTGGIVTGQRLEGSPALCLSKLGE